MGFSACSSLSGEIGRSSKRAGTSGILQQPPPRARSVPCAIPGTSSVALRRRITTRCARPFPRRGRHRVAAPSHSKTNCCEAIARSTALRISAPMEAYWGARSSCGTGSHGGPAIGGVLMDCNLPSSVYVSGRPCRFPRTLDIMMQHDSNDAVNRCSSRSSCLQSAPIGI